jgi:hypothetical protein
MSDYDEADEDEVLDMSEDDYKICDMSWQGGYAVSQYGKMLFETKTIRKALKKIRKHMEQAQWWPSIYYVNDHGNIELLDYEGNVIKGWV